MRKKLLFAVIGLSCGLQFLALDAYAAQIGKQEVAMTFTNSYVSRYVWRGIDLFPDNDASYQPSVDLALKKLFKNTDLSFNVWGAFPTQSGHELSTELDYTVKLSHDFTDFNLSAGHVYFDYTKKNDRSDVNEAWASFSLFKIPFIPIDTAFNLFAAYEYEAKLGGPEEGWYYSWGFSTKVPLARTALTQEGQALSFGITNWGNDGVAGLKPSYLYATEFVVATSYIMKNFSFTPGFHYVANYVDSINNKNETWGGIDISYSF